MMNLVMMRKMLETNQEIGRFQINYQLLHFITIFCYFFLISSENEIEKDFAAYPKPKKNSNLKRSIVNKFEDDMNKSLNSIISNLEQKQKEDLKTIEINENALKEKNDVEMKIDEKNDEENEEDSDTDSEQEEATGQRVKKKREHFTNDELFYDPTMDDQDEKWMNEQRVT